MGSLDTFWFIINTTIGPGIFSIPSSIFCITGSVGITFVLWIVGNVSVALEFAMAIPRSGGEKNYLERVYRRPKFLITCVMAALYIFLGGPASSSIAFASYILQAAGHPDPTGSWLTRVAAVGCVTGAILVHTLLPKWGIRVLRVLGHVKLVIMAFIICSGFAALTGHRRVPDPHNFENVFAMESGDGWGASGAYGYANAIIRIGYTYGGANVVTTVLGELKSPRKTLPIVTPLALSTVTILYLLVNVAYFAAIPKDSLAKSDVIVAGVFFRNMFGESAAARVLPAFVGLNNLGNVLTLTFAHGRMNQEFAKEGILPYSHFWASDKPFGAPGPALLLNWLATVVVIIVPPPGPIYTFLIDLIIYPHIVLAAMSVCGLLWLRLRLSEKWSSPFKCPLVVILMSITIHFFLLVMPLVPSPTGRNAQGYPYFVFPVAGLGILAIGALYWVAWAKVFPRLGGYRIEATRSLDKEGKEMVEFRRINTTSSAYHSTR
ncbi:amino acid/polyamine transporter I [Pseudomassariella vexata]|uniref:Amino acid/polyamine transporter I n=1 Tax=Pseudomassariella vexata TaxID=1141098 RepID=A0A1Y2EJZ9_9PEZI|nr:amino acid/polyamine transporter I [Pseudomassariella vexata]ORY71869.1 amino acid/polyamine transporter I [Pseudomassariella vexata]